MPNQNYRSFGFSDTRSTVGLPLLIEWLVDGKVDKLNVVRIMSLINDQISRPLILYLEANKGTKYRQVFLPSTITSSISSLIEKLTGIITFTLHNDTAWCKVTLHKSTGVEE